MVDLQKTKSHTFQEWINIWQRFNFSLNEEEKPSELVSVSTTALKTFTSL